MMSKIGRDWQRRKYSIVEMGICFEYDYII